MNVIRIAMVVFSHFPSDTRVLREAEALVEAGISMDVICLRGEGQPSRERVNGINVYRIHLERKRAGKLRYLWEYAYFFIAAFIRLSLLHTIKGYRIIHAHNLPDILVFTALFPKMTGSKVILDIHDLMPEFYARKYGIPESHWIIKGIQYLERISAKFANHVVTASPFFRKSLIERSSTPEECTTILNLPDPKYFYSINTVDNSRKNGNFRIIYPGTLGEIHGVDIAIKAIKRITEESDIGIEFHIYGRGAVKERNRLIIMTKELNLGDFVYFHMGVPIDKLAAVLKSMDVGVVTKRDGVHAQDAISTKLFEFAEVGLPAVVSRTKSDSLYFNDSMVMFFEPENEKDLSDCIIRLYKNPELRKSLSKEAKKLSEQLNWETEKMKLRGIYEHILHL